MNKQTKNQHYIPQMILKRFSCWSKQKKNGKKKYFVRTYDKYSNEIRLVSTDTICFKKWLYEIYQENEILNPNLIEKEFSQYEKQWDIRLNKIENDENLSEEDVAWLKVLFIMQFLRAPEIIKMCIPLLRNMAPELITSNEQAERYFKISSFGYGSFTEEEQWLFKFFYDRFAKNKQLVIYDSKTNFLLNGINPVLLGLLELRVFRIKNIKEGDYFPIFLPISSNICLGLINSNIINENDNMTARRCTIPNTFTDIINQINYNESNFLIARDYETFGKYKENKYYADYRN